MNTAAMFVGYWAIITSGIAAAVLLYGVILLYSSDWLWRRMKRSERQWLIKQWALRRIPDEGPADPEGGEND